MNRQIIALILLGLCVIPAAYGEYYTYADSEGNVHFTDNPLSIPPQYRKKMQRVDVDMGPVKQPPPAPPQNMYVGDPNKKRARKATAVTGIPPSNASQEPEQALSSRLPQAAPQEVAEPALSTPLKTIRHFRRSLARGDYAEAAKCLLLHDPQQIQALLSQLPKDYVKALSDDLQEAVEISRTENEAYYMIGDPRTRENKVWKRHEVHLVRKGANWKIVR